jgi:putative DNA primase/helicase
VPSRSKPTRAGKRYDLAAFLARNNLDVIGPDPFSDGVRYVFKVCPFNPDHTNLSAWVAQFASGAIDAGCQHDSCHWGWKELREKFEPRTRNTTRPALSPLPAESSVSPAAIDSEDLRSVSTLCTDIGNAARLVLRYRDMIRFCPPWGRWMVNRDGQRWKTDDRGEVVQLAKNMALAIFDEIKGCTDTDQQQRLAKWAIKSQSRERINAALDLAKPNVAIVPSELDVDQWLLNTPNGTVDLRTGLLRPHERKDYITKMCQATYDINATSPVFFGFLDRICRTHPELISYLRKAAGYAATGSIQEQVLFFLHGNGANGKTTWLDAVMYALGDYASKADRELLAASDRGSQHPTNVADLQGRRLVVCSETNDGGRLDEAKLKDLAGETRLKARLMYGNFFEFAASAKIFLYSNHRPIVRGTDLGLWRRMRLIPFVETIGDTEKDGSLPEKLIAESSGILSWIIGGCLLWQREGLGLPSEVARATNSYRVEMDTIGAFLSDQCEFNSKFSVGASELYKAYRSHCEQAGEYVLSQTRFGRKLAERPGLSSVRNGIGQRCWRGVAIQEAEQPTPHFG